MNTIAWLQYKILNIWGIMQLRVNWNNESSTECNNCERYGVITIPKHTTIPLKLTGKTNQTSHPSLTIKSVPCGCCIKNVYSNYFRYSDGERKNPDRNRANVVVVAVTLLSLICLCLPNSAYSVLVISRFETSGRELLHFVLTKKLVLPCPSLPYPALG